MSLSATNLSSLSTFLSDSVSDDDFLSTMMKSLTSSSSVAETGELCLTVQDGLSLLPDARRACHLHHFMPLMSLLLLLLSFILLLFYYPSSSSSLVKAQTVTGAHWRRT